MIFCFNFFNLKINEYRCIELFVVSRSIQKLFSVEYVNIYLFLIYLLMDFILWKSVGLTYIAYVLFH